MVFLTELEHRLRRFNNWVAEVENQGKPPRPIVGPEVQSFLAAADERRPSRTHQQIMERIILANPARYHRMMREYRWFQKQVAKQGLNPEDARFML